MSNRNHEQMPDNVVISAEAKIKDVLRELNSRGKELQPQLPADTPLVAFLANVNSALRANPKLIACTFESIVNACVKAAYDGLRIDGREAALVDSEESFQVSRGNYQKRKVARYMPMVFGLIKQILDSGAALAVKAVIVYENEEKTGRFKLLEGTVQGIHHEPLLHGEKGDMIGAYAIATIAPGVFKFEWMDKAAILDIAQEAKTKKVWDRWPKAMWQKTVIRQLRKTLNGTSRIHDAEARDLFPHFDSTAAHPQLAPPRPTRQAMLEQQQDNGTPLDLGNQWGEDNRERVEAEQDKPRDDAQAKEQERRQAQKQEREESPVIPHGDLEWGVWGVELEALIEKAADVAALAQLQAGNAAVLKHASKAVQSRIAQAFTDRAADFAVGSDDGAAAGGGDDETAAGDRS